MNEEEAAPVLQTLHMHNTDSQNYIFSLVEYLYGSLTASPFLELMRRSISKSASRWSFYARDLDYMQLFRFYMKGTSAAGILTSKSPETPFMLKRAHYSEPINDIDIMINVNPFVGQIDYTIIRGLLMGRLVEALNAWINDPTKTFRDQIFQDGTTSSHVWSAPLTGQINEESYVIQKTLFGAESNRIVMPNTCPIYYKLTNNLIIGGERSGISLLKIMSRPFQDKRELIDIVIPSHAYTRCYTEWTMSDWLVMHQFNAGRQITLPILHPQYLATEFNYAIEANARPEKRERRTDALNAVLELIAENEMYQLIEEAKPDT